MDVPPEKRDYLIDLIEKYADTLIRVSYTYMKNMSDAEDLAQDAFIKLMEKRPSFENSEHEKAWLIRVTINLCKNRLRTAWHKRTVPLDDSTYSFSEDESQVMGTVMELPAKYRGIILLFYYEEYSIAEIAKILGRKESTVGSQLHRARVLLKSKLMEDFDGE